MQSARITPQVPLMINWEDQGDVTEPGLQSSQIRSARLEQRGGSLLCTTYLVLGGRNAPREREPPRLQIGKPAQAGELVAVAVAVAAAYLVGSETRGRLDLSVSLGVLTLDADRHEFLLFSQVQIMRTSTSNPVSPPHQQKAP
jgi:hypothetical protein